MARRILALAALVLASSSVLAQGGRPGNRAPEINFKTLDGKTIRLSELRGHPVVVTFWASWCDACRKEFPALVAARERHRESGLEVLAVNQRNQELREADVRKFLAEFPVNFPVILDKTGSTRRGWGLLGLPTTAFIDSAGVIRKIIFGPLPEGELDRGLATILTVPAATVPPG
jgi:cytochrome c biogenesis protein CcmG/thiol:disulfide interchange protein DsbE